MKQIAILFLIGLFMGGCSPKANGQYDTVKLQKNNVAQIIEAMTFMEKVSLVVGGGMTGSSIGAAGITRSVPRLGIPALELSDGPAGLRLKSSENTWFPSASLLASTWDTSLVTEVGKAMGAEALAHGADVILGPAMNIHRHPLCGRNFEYYSEDPLLSGKMASAMVLGIQETGVGACLKHFVANNQETNRDNNNVIAGERTLREIYYRSFEIAVKESSPKTIMTSYNRINGIYTSEDKNLLTEILRYQWKFDGLVMTDWFGGQNAPGQIRAGNDLLEPGRRWQRRAIMKAVKNGELREETVNTSVRRILNLVVDSPSFTKQVQNDIPTVRENATIARKAASRGMVLLENRNALPLNDSIQRIALFGVAAYQLVAGGVGSGEVYAAHTVSPAEGLEEAGYLPDPPLRERYQSYIDSVDRAYKRKWKSITQRILGKGLPAEMDPGAVAIARAATENQAALITLGRKTGEFSDRKIEGDYLLTATEKELIKNVSKAFRDAGKPVIVVLNVGGIVETASWSGQPDAVILAWMPGQEGGRALADILSGKVNPSGKLPVTIPLRLEDCLSHQHFPLEEVPVNWLSFIGKKQTKPDTIRPNIDFTRYDEGIYVGYRDFDKNEKDVAYPFGYGLSYTEFRYSNAVAYPENEKVVVTCQIINSGERAGREVVQVYVSAPDGEVEKPVQELRGFVTTSLLEPGESQEIKVIIPLENLASFVPETGWVVDSGEYTFRIGSSSRDIRQEIRLPGIPEWIVPLHAPLPWPESRLLPR
ncbi:MAG: beta-glucosidase [Bacteroidales bacterium]|jgi:beta-glucosidase